ncbi:Uncharacterized protein dnl_38940 [Desulfonema limicola]|uniref:ZU5 domain-containing protein n=1 Tax=Desulfonema limicola TaxID=45656 RepID=A0A975B9S7_9BACT|nr:hypothetical protein [Desulfonema limicola]QTA81556.1 Uncharacterized protein dnl_38940 [Desulfonema limicola]
MLKKTFINGFSILVLAVFMILGTGCGGGGDDDGGTYTDPVDNSQDDQVKPPSVNDGKLVLEAQTIIVQQAVASTGGTIQVDSPGSGIDGLTMEIPAGAYSTDKSISISTQKIQSHSAGTAFNPLTPLIHVTGAEDIADEIIRVNIPVTVPENYFAMAFFYDPETQKFEGMPLINQGRDFVTTATRHFSSFVVSAVNESELKAGMPIDSGFLPGADDFRFANYGSWLTPGGHCAGQSIGAIWYYDQEKGAGEPDLHGNFDNNSQTPPTPGIWQDDTHAYKFCSIVQYDIDWTDLEGKISQAFQDANPALVWKAFAYSILLTNEPQLEGMFTAPDEDGRKSGHAMVIYGVEENDDQDAWRLLVADPNYPAKQDRYIYFDETGLLEPYSSAANAQDAAAGYGKQYTNIYYIGKGALFPWNSVANRFEELEEGTIGNDIFPECTIVTSIPVGNEDRLVEIKDNFLETSQPLIYLYSSVKNESGEESVAYLSVFEGRDSTVPIDVDLEKTYPAMLKEGDNWFGFYSKTAVNNYYKFLDFQWINIYYKPEPTYVFEEYVLQDNLRLTEDGFVPEPYTVTGSIQAPNITNPDEGYFNAYDANQHVYYNTRTFSADITSKLPFYIKIQQNVEGLWTTHSYTLPNTDQVLLTRARERYWLHYKGSDGSDLKGYSDTGTMTLMIDKSNLKAINEEMGLYVFEGNVNFSYRYNTNTTNPATSYEFNGSVERDELFLTFLTLFVTVPQ